MRDGHRIFARTLFIGWIGGSDNSAIENADNARLIALAPSLAAAYKALREENERLNDQVKLCREYLEPFFPLPPDDPLDSARGEGDGNCKTQEMNHAD